VEILERCAHKSHQKIDEEKEKRQKTKPYHHQHLHESRHRLSENGRKTRLGSYQTQLISKKIGAKKGWREAEGAEWNSRPLSEMDGVYEELGQLREYKNCVTNAITRLKQVPYIREVVGPDDTEENHSVFAVLNFLTELEGRFGRQEGDPQKLFEAEKQIEFLQGRLSQL
jgi:hypothetical protein